MDGYSYLAKMHQGWKGDFLFVLPYASEPGEPVFLFGFYLFLGHLARIFKQNLIVFYHISRIIGALFLFLVLVKTVEKHIDFPLKWRRIAICLLVFGSGMGWLVVPLGMFTSDFWVAEAYVFLSSYTNPHFPVGMALFLLLLFEGDRHGTILKWILNILLSVLLAVIMPFGLVLLIIIRSINFAFVIWSLRKFYIPEFVFSLIPSVLLLLYQSWVSNLHPILQIWNAQNITKSPDILDLIISFSPMIIFSFIGFLFLRRETFSTKYRLLTIWLFVGLALIYAPFSLQRRFTFGIFIPIVLLGLFGLMQLHQRSKGNWLIWVITGLSLPTNIILILAGFGGLIGNNEAIFLHRCEKDALFWLMKNTPENAIVLASPDTSLFIPALAGRKVVYGHPFETPNAVREKEGVLQFFSGLQTISDQLKFVTQHHVDYIFWGPREHDLGGLYLELGNSVVFSCGDVQIIDLENNLK